LKPGYLHFDSQQMGIVTVSGYYLTRMGRKTYCEHCQDLDEKVLKANK